MSISVQRTNSTRFKALVVRADRAAIATLIPFVFLGGLYMSVQLPVFQAIVWLVIMSMYANHFRKPIDVAAPLPWLGWVVGVASLWSIAVITAGTARLLLSLVS